MLGLVHVVSCLVVNVVVTGVEAPTYQCYTASPPLGLLLFLFKTTVIINCYLNYCWPLNDSL